MEGGGSSVGVLKIRIYYICVCNYGILYFTENPTSNIRTQMFWVGFSVKFRISKLHTHIYIYTLLEPNWGSS